MEITAVSDTYLASMKQVNDKTGAIEIVVQQRELPYGRTVRQDVLPLSSSEETAVDTRVEDI
jgi:hypothetical protein